MRQGGSSVPSTELRRCVDALISFPPRGSGAGGVQGLVSAEVVVQYFRRFRFRGLAGAVGFRGIFWV